MKKLIKTAFMYVAAAVAGGVFYREFTKFMLFEERTTLAFVHVHLFVLGAGVFLILALFSLQTDLMEQKKFRMFYITYNISLPLMVAMLLVRGICQVLNTPLSKGADAAISGISGIVHILFTLALVLLFICMKNLSLKKGRGEIENEIV
ncbi:MAG: DUF2871 domain-containing protein [Lachnospiraceae bacterium]